jgi:hypothetical protein
VVGHVGLLEHAAFAFVELGHCGLWGLRGLQCGRSLWLALHLLQEYLIGVLVVDLLEHFRTTLPGVLLILDRQELFDDAVFLNCSPFFLLFFQVLAFLVALLELPLELADCLFEFGQWPALQIVAAFLGGGEVLLKLFGVVVFLDDLLEEVLLLLLLVRLHQLYLYPTQ